MINAIIILGVFDVFTESMVLNFSLVDIAKLRDTIARMQPHPSHQVPAASDHVVDPRVPEQSAAARDPEI